jgi:hypothetical protein
MSYVSYTTNPRDLQLELISILNTLGTMFNPTIGFRITAIPVQLPFDINGHDLSELISLEAKKPDVQKYIQGDYKLADLWPTIQLYRKESNNSRVKIIPMNMELMI